MADKQVDRDAALADENHQRRWPDLNILGEPGEHGEIKAINRLLWQREADGLPVDQSVFGELILDNRGPHLPGRNFPPDAVQRGAVPMACCAHCANIIPDVPTRTGQFVDPIEPGIRGPQRVRLLDGRVETFEYEPEYTRHFEPDRWPQSP